MRSLGITIKLTLILMAFAVLLLATISALAYTSGSNSLQAAAISELLSSAIYKQTNLDSWIEDAKVHTIALASSPDFLKSLVGFLAVRA